MKTTKLLLLITVITLASTPLWAKGNRGNRQRNEQMGKGNFFEMLEEKNPEKAVQLRELKENDPNAFREEMKKIGARHRRSRREKGNDDMQGRYRRKMKGDSEKFMAWLEKSYPEKAQKLAELKDENGGRFSRAAMQIAKKYRPIYNNELKGNTELVSILKDEIALRQRTGEITTKIKATTNEDEKRKLTAELKFTLSEKFDNIIAKRNLQSLDLQKKLGELQKELKEMEEKTVEIKANKDKEVQNKLDNILSKKSEFQWN